MMKQLSVLFAFLSIGLLASIVLGGDLQLLKQGNAKRVSLACQGSECPQPVVKQSVDSSFRPTSCLDYLRNGEEKCGVYKIYDNFHKSFPVYCDMKTEPGSAWTLVMSWSQSNKALNAFKKMSFSLNSPVNEDAPNWKLYRQTLARMQSLKSHSTHWRATCSYPTHGVDYTDYLRGNFKDFDITSFTHGGLCKKVDLVNIRGHLGIHQTARFLQSGSAYILHIDSSSSGCQFVPTSGAASGEDNFGYYYNVNAKFRCTAGPQATTQWWFGGHL